MLELPEIYTIAKQINTILKGKVICTVEMNHSPHKFAFYNGNPEEYPALLRNKQIEGAAYYGGLVELTIGNMLMLLGDGVNLRFLKSEEEALFPKHQMKLVFEDKTLLLGTVQMYGSLWACPKGQDDNIYHTVAREKPSPLTNRFNEQYFSLLLKEEGVERLSTKAFLATKQRIPGLGNGVAQDILWNAGLHPKRKMGTLKDIEKDALFHALKDTLFAMAQLGGRNTEKDLFGNTGGYTTILCKNTVAMPCRKCGGTITKESYLGGTVYYCAQCQPLIAK